MLTLQLEAVDARLRGLLDLTASIVFEFDVDGRYLEVLPQSESLLAAPREALLGRTLSEVPGPEGAAPFIVKSTVGKGTCFRVLLPAAPPDTVPAPD